MKSIILTKQPVDLFKILKFEGLVNSGGEAKALVSEGKVMVNGVVETRKSRKIMAGDVIEFNKIKYKTECP